MSTFKELYRKVVNLKKNYKTSLQLLEHTRDVFDFFADQEAEIKNKIIEKYTTKVGKRRDLINLFNTKEEFNNYIEEFKNNELQEVEERYDTEVRPYEEKMEQIDDKVNKYLRIMIDLKEKIKESFKRYLPSLLPCLYKKKNIEDTCVFCQEEYNDEHPADVKITCNCNNGKGKYEF